MGEVAYRFKLTEAARIHSVFHMSQLKKAIGDKKVEKDLPSELQVACENSGH